MGKGASKEEKKEEEPKRTSTPQQRSQDSNPKELKRTPTQPQSSQQPSSKDRKSCGVPVRQPVSRSQTTSEIKKTPTQPQDSRQSNSKDRETGGVRVRKTVSVSQTTSELKTEPTNLQSSQQSSSKDRKSCGVPVRQPVSRSQTTSEIKKTPTQPQDSRQSNSKDRETGGVRVRKTVSVSQTTSELKTEPTNLQSSQQSSSKELKGIPTQPQASQQSSSDEHRSENLRDINEVESKADDEPPQAELTIFSRRRSDALFVAVIDFGTTKTGFCYSTKYEPNRLHAFVNGKMGEQPEKFPTVLLLQPDKKFHSFGTEAVEMYKQLVKQNLHREWYYFERFKMKLHAREKLEGRFVTHPQSSNPLTKDMVIDDNLGKTMFAMDVFVAAINFIRTKMLDELKGISMVRDTDVHWVLTVPAIWDDLSKQFMREAAETAGIPCYMLTLALEPEAASLFCRKHLKVEEGNTSRYMILDLGGGTVDIACHEVNSKGTLKELHPPTGGAFGGTTVDNAFISVLCRLFGSDVIQAFKKSEMQKYLELMAGFELKKSYFDGSGDVTLKVPVELKEIYLDFVEEPFEKSIKQSTLVKNVKLHSDHIKLSETLMKDIFNTAVLNIKEATADLLQKVKSIDYIFLVGGFSESPYVKRVIKEHFGNLAVFSDEASTAVLRGACIFGHEPGAISSRICKYTYGIARLAKFDHRIHPERKKVRMGRFTFCDDVFCKHIELGTEVSVFEPDKSITQDYYPSAADQRQAVLEVYRSTEKDPMFTDDESCKLVGLIKVDMDPKGDVWTKLNVRLIFGGTELVVEVTDEKNKTLTRGSVDFFG